VVGIGYRREEHRQLKGGKGKIIRSCNTRCRRLYPSSAQ
jgi:hypothetical protein